MTYDSLSVFDTKSFSSHYNCFCKKQISDVKTLPLGISLGIDDGIELGWSEGTSRDRYTTLELGNSLLKNVKGETSITNTTAFAKQQHQF